MLKRLMRGLVRLAYRAVLPAGVKNTLRQWTALDRPDQPVEVIEDFSRGPVLALAPHMDDEVFGCGGALRRHVLAGARVTVVFLTDGARGNPDIERDATLDRAGKERAVAALVARRKQESREAARCLGFHELIFLDGPDGGLRPTPEIVGQVGEIVARVRPAVVYLPTLLDTHGDHWNTGRIFYRAIGELNGRSPAGMICREYEVWSPLVANRLADIEPVLDAKREAMRQFTSQLERFDLINVSLGLNRYRSMYPFRGRGHVEAFHESTPETFRTIFERLTEKR